MNRIKNLNFKKALIYTLPMLLAFAIVFLMFYFSSSSVSPSVKHNNTIAASTQAAGGLTLDMAEPESKHYYDELYNAYNNGDDSKAYACALYQAFEDNIYNILSGEKFEVQSYFERFKSGLTSSFYYEDNSVFSAELQNGFDAFSMDYPAISYLFNPPNSSATPTKIEISCGLSGLANIEEAITGINTMTTLAKSFGFTGETNYEKVLVAHDFLTESIVYDLSAAMNQTAYSGLINRRTVCAGYARSFKYIMDCWDIPCILVSGVGGNSASPEAHMWNYVNLNDIWYCIDVTWDDSGSSTLYDYFLIDFDTFKNDRGQVHTLHNRIAYNGGGSSEMYYNFPSPSNSTYLYPSDPSVEEEYTLTLTPSINTMVETVDYKIDLSDATVKRGCVINFEITIVSKDSYFLLTPALNSTDSKPIFISQYENAFGKPVYVYKIIITNEDCAVTMNFDTYFHDITFTQLNPTDGTLSLSKTKAEKNEIVELNINLATSTIAVKKISIKDENNKEIDYTTVTENKKYTFVMPGSNVSIQVELALYRLISQGTISGGGATLEFSKNPAIVGDTITVEVKNIDEGKRAFSLNSDQVTEFTSLGRKSNKFTFVMPDQDVTINAVIGDIPPTVFSKDIKTSLSNGSATVSFSSTEAEVGEEITIKILAGFGKNVKSISCEGVEFKTIVEGQEYSFVIPSEDFEISIELGHKYGFDLMIIVYAILGLVGFMFIIFLFVSIPRKKDKSKMY